MKKAQRKIDDLFIDLSDGSNLRALLQVLAQPPEPIVIPEIHLSLKLFQKHEKGTTRIHRLQNAQICLDFLRSQQVRTVNIRAEDIVDGNAKLTLGLIWTIILRYQVCAKGLLRLLISP